MGNHHSNVRYNEIFMELHNHSACEKIVVNGNRIYVFYSCGSFAKGCSLFMNTIEGFNKAIDHLDQQELLVRMNN